MNDLIKVISVKKSIDDNTFQPQVEFTVILNFNIELLQDMIGRNPLDTKAELVKVLVDELEIAYINHIKETNTNEFK